ncbi:MAG: ABC-F family ATP-binding cassette domain-containing protein [Erysipelotrichaceae bacterium]|uniref:ABC-F family ATP-binding cassette domain-containing protein n=1 Tax=Floccifex sp. TaxID=2815810 RepID=UPI002A747EF7|nr:ABC-F family ATP-binding cassette domain-containing protein [Floccifex sp.]MDD7280778.1 ABC-F family ATP-binding cassette domain-containing protein [Erysipelotrichaceae bacterium]MDY2959083.1 ABC-F family ATP-binding cassette domain-containing protein [Floccifex sp.]
MSILTVEKLSHSFAGRTIFEDVSFRLLKGEHVGLVGANGEGKSTFMNILTRHLEPESGKIQWSKNVKVGYLDQHTVLEEGLTIRDTLKMAYADLFEIEESINQDYMKMGDEDIDMDALLEDIGTRQEYLDQHDFYLIDSKIEEVANSLGISDYGLDRSVNELSGGQRSKVLLGKLLLEKPDILLLDEPTNYLDVEHINWLKNYLKNYDNAFILVSHDIPFLNEVVNVIYHVQAPYLTRYAGNYDEFERVYEIKKKQLESAYVRQQQEIEKMEDFIARNKARVATRGMANSRKKRLDKMERIELIKEKPKPEFHFLMGKTPSKWIFEAKDIVIGYDRPLSKPMTINLEKGKKIAICGANGLGKSTLIKSLLKKIDVLEGSVQNGDNLQIAYFQQEEKAPSLSCIDDLWNTFPSWTQYEIRSALAKCGLTTDQIESMVYVLSGGEQAKLRLCKLMNNPSNVLVLDEPTNHLDIDAKDELKRALIEYPGTVILVCHEPEFYEDFVDEVWDMKEYALK